MTTIPELHGPTRRRTRAHDLGWNLVFACWLIATAATLSALFFSEVMSLPPCALFVSIPLLSLVAFSVISALLVVTHYKVAK